MRVLVTGATGLIGTRACRALTLAGHSVMVVSRNPGRVPWKGVAWDGVRQAVSESDAIVNLAGEPIAAGRWTAARKAEIRASRTDATRAIVAAIADAAARPKLLLNASAVGWYGPHGDEELDETAPAGEGFLADVCRAWEADAARAEPLGVRVVRLRLGVVLAPDGGALARMLLPFRAALGGVLGHGRQWMSWVHVDDVVGLVLDVVGTEAYRGPVNATAPTPVTNREFTRTLAAAVGRPAIVPVPAVAMRLVLGEMAEMLLTGQRVRPAAATANGYAWRHPELAAALRACLEQA